MEKGVYSQEITLRFCDCDYKKRARVATLMAYMADIAGVAYTKKGYSHSWLWERNFVFLVSRASMTLHRIPKADETVTLTTWEREIKGALFYRDFAITDKTGATIVEASTAWVLANPQTRQILRPSEFTGDIDAHPDIKANAPHLGKIKPPADCILQQAGERTIVYSDIDANGHVYNAVYLGIACDFLPESFIAQDFKTIRINFRQEAKLGEHMCVKFHVTDRSAYIIGEVNDGISFDTMITLP